MINLFQFAPKDKSLEYLIDIFGSMNGIIFDPSSGGASGGSSITLLGTMFKTFNSVILSVAVLIVIYATVVGVMKTAHEGEPMGKQWNSLWIPIRMVLGIASLVPTGSGYCALQMVMMWVIVQGIGAADSLWNTALSYVNVVGSPYGQVTIPTVGVANSLNGLFQALTCDQTAKITAADPAGLKKGGYFCSSNKSGYCTSTFQELSPNTSTTSYSIGPNGSCGVLTYCNQESLCSGNNSTSLKCTSCKAQVAALREILPVLTGVAQGLAQADYSYRQFYYSSSVILNNASWKWIYDYCAAQTPPIPRSECCVPSRSPIQFCQANKNNPGVPGNPNFPTPNANDVPQNASEAVVKALYWPYAIQPLVGGNVDFINTAVNYYSEQVTAAVTDYITEQGKNINNLGGDLSDAAQVGWIFAGAYYYAIASSNNKNLEDSIPDLTMTVGDPAADSSNPMSGYRNNFEAASTLEAVASGQSGTFASTPQLSQIGSALGAANKTVSETFTSSAKGSSGGSNPLSALQMTGAVLLGVVVLLYPVLLILAFVLGTASHLNWFTLGTGMMLPISGGVLMLTMFLVPALFGFLAILTSLGATLGIYVPLIPYVVFTFGAIGWFIMTIETMVAGPLVALGILSPSGEHEILGKSQHALMLLFDVFLRPSLMIFGLMAAMLLASVVVEMINYAFWTTVLEGISMGGAAMANPLEIIIYLSAYISLLVAALNKCFQTIYLVPQGVLSWIGGQGKSYGGEAEGVQAAEKGVSAGSGGAQSAMTKGQSGAAEGGGTLAGQVNKAAKKAEKDKKPPGGTSAK